MTKIDEAKNLMDEGWKAREDLQFEKAENLLEQAKYIFEEEGDWFNVTECLNHLAYNCKIQAVYKNLQGLVLAKESKAIAEQHGTKTVLATRALISLASSGGYFEQALQFSKEIAETFDKPAPKSDILAHIAGFELRTGNLTQATKTIDSAEKLLLENFDQEREPHRSIWLSKIYATKAMILYNSGDVKNAKDYLAKAKELAEKQNLKARLDEIEAVEPLFS